jgi:hypothetical protein
MRYLLLIAPLALLGCEDPEPSPEIQMIQAACEGGDLAACQYLDQRRIAGLAAMSAAMGRVTAANTHQLPPPAPPPQRTNCVVFSNQVNCTTQ